MKSQIILAGSGGCMRELAWQMPDWQISGYVDVTPPEHPIKVGDRIIPYLGKDDILLQQTKDINVAIAVGDPALRQKIAQKLQTNPHIHFPNLILHGAEVCSDVKLGQGCIISMDARVSTNVRMGDFVFLNIGAMVCHDGRLGDYVTLAPDVKLAGVVHIRSHWNKGDSGNYDCGSCAYRCGSRCCAGCGGSRYGCWCTGAKDKINIDFSMSYG